MSSSMSPDTPAGMFSADRIGGFGYGIAVSVGILLLITTITLASYYCTRSSGPGPLPPGMRRHRATRWHSNREAASIDTDYDVEAGIDEETLMSYPKLLYSDAVLNKDGEKMGVSGCSICLGEYKMKDELRQLPDCGHVFHVKCVDPWLRLHPTCPLCRTSPLPSPMPTPLAEVAPLAAARQV